MKLYRGKRRNHPTAKLRQIARRVRQLRGKLTVALSLGAMLYLAVR